ncbi:hypothetical protein [Cobetia marina]|uniref:hypothetical protein n=1 Tax=Cobetia marina TaxID=28258 RepID=UPI00385795C9
MIKKKYSNAAIVHNDGFFGIGWPVTSSLNLEDMKIELKKYFIEVSLIDISELQEHEIESDCLYITSSSQNKNIKKYYEDVLEVKFSNKNNLIPRYELIRAHDNKGYQGLLAKKLNLRFTPQYYTYKSFDVKDKTVMKGLGGAGSSTVSMVKSNSDIYKQTLKMGLKNTGLLDLLKNSKYKLKRKFKGENYDGKRYDINELYVLQEYHEGLSCDYKVLVFGDKVFVLKRSVRKGDFRASGSGLFDFGAEFSISLLDFSLSFKNDLGAPYVSLDIIEKDDGTLSCIEYQCVHFGLMAQIKAPFYYEKNNNNWVKCENNTKSESLLVDSISKMVEEHACKIS